MTDQKSYDQITELDLMGYVDGRLDPARRAEVEAYLLQQPEENARIRAYIAQNEAIRSAFDDIAEEPVPARLTAATHWPRRRSFTPALRWVGVAASVALAAGGGWWAGHSGLRVSPLGGAHIFQTQQATQPQALPASGEAQPLLEQLQQQPLIEEQTISELNRSVGGSAFGMNFTPPDLSLFGYELQNARQVEKDDAPALHLLYSDENGETVAIMLAPRERPESPSVDVSRENDFNIVNWSDGPLELKIVSKRDEDQLRKMAGKVGESMSYSLHLPQNKGQFAGQAIEDNRLSDRTLGPLLNSDQVSSSSGPM